MFSTRCSCFLLGKNQDICSFTLDARNYIKAMRLFVGEPVWTPYNREAEGTDVMSQRTQYVTDFVETTRPAGSGMLVESKA
jgi:hypothetical protein